MPHDPTPIEARAIALRTWLAARASEFDLLPETLCPASSDASFRRYYRVATRGKTPGSFIVMDAPPELEDSHTFVEVAKRLAKAQVSVPAVFATDFSEGFVLLSDLGSTTYLDALNAQSASGLYRDALDALVRIQVLPLAETLPHYDRPLLERELRLFPIWYLERHRDHSPTSQESTVLESTFQALIERALAQPRVLVHRDYHSRNLMVLPPEEASGNPGILDFQDAVFGPITYDLVSLLRDAYIVWEEEQVLDWCVRYWEAARRAKLPVASDFGEFWQDFEWMGLQRHLKILGIFARLHHRDGKDNYLKDLPAVLRYVRAVASRYREFFALARLLDALESQGPQVGYTF